MKISTFMPITNPILNSYPFLQAIESHLPFSDELLIIDGGSTDGSLEQIKLKFGDQVKVLNFPWAQGKGEWTWEQFARTWNYGYDNADGDFVIAGECDHVFQESEAEKVRKVLEDRSKNMVVFFDKFVTSTWDRLQSKSKFAYALNKGNFKLGYGLDPRPALPQDLASPIIIRDYDSEYGIPVGELITAEHGRTAGVNFVNYDKTFQTEEQILRLRENANYAWNNSIMVKGGFANAWEEDNIIEDVKRRMKSRYERSPYRYNLHDHPIVMREWLKALNPEQLGFNLLGEIK